MTDPAQLQQAVIEKLKSVIDPETNADVIRMRLVQDIHVDEQGKITCTFRPSSPLCPIAAPIALMIMQAVSEVAGITAQEITVIDYVGAEQLNALLRTALGE